MENPNIAFERWRASRKVIQNTIECNPIDTMDGALSMVHGIIVRSCFKQGLKH
jgi:hypothetical protein